MMFSYGLILIIIVFIDVNIDYFIIGKFSPDWFIWLRLQVLILGLLLVIVGAIIPI